MDRCARVKVQFTASLPTKRSNMAAKILMSALAAAALFELACGRPEPPSSYLPPARGNRPSSGYGAPFSGSGSSGGYGAPNYGGGGGNYDDQSEPAHYQFQYEVDAPEYGTNFGHMESRDGDVARGTYHVLLPDGRMQTVQYVADQNGYRPEVSYKDSGRGAFGGGGAGGYGGGGAGGYGGGGAGGGNGGYRY